jgi:stage II sporulation protein D
VRRLLIHRLLPLIAILSLTCARTLPPPVAEPSELPEDVQTPDVSSEPPPLSGEMVGMDIEEAPGQDDGPTTASEPVPLPATASPAVPRVVRVGLATDLQSVVLPCCDAELAAVYGDRRIAVVTKLVVEPGVGTVEPALFRLQVSALRDEQQALHLAREIGALSDLETTVVFDAGSGLYKVRVGSFETREAAENGRRALAQRNLHDAWIVSEQRPPRNPALKLSQGRRQWLVRSRWLAFEPQAPGKGIAVLGKRYRGRILVYLNDRGTLNLINEVELDDYLRGVVPREMGPEVFDSLDALKSQAVAARSYALRNMGEFGSEGFDICATPRCQVYGGMDDEHPLSDRAVLETSGEVLIFKGEFADALYSSTCGGHTENVEVVFPLKHAAYLRGVPCHESGVERIGGTLDRGVPLAVGLARELVPSLGAAESVADFSGRLETLADLAGIRGSGEPLRSLGRRDVQQYIASRFDLANDARLLTSSDDIPYLLESPPAGWTSDDLRLAAYMLSNGLLSGSLESSLDAREMNETIFNLSLLLRVLEERRTRFLSLEEDSLTVRENDGERTYTLPDQIATFSRRSGDFVAAALAVVPGDRLRLYLSRGQLLGIAHEVDLDGAAYDRTSNLSSWTRFRSDAQLAERVRERYPSIDFEGFEILERGVSGRVARMRIRGSNGSTVDVTGLPVRWTFDLPDTLFTAKRLAPSDEASGWLFSGRGWGHGVGMCQVGSYGMAVRGHDYRDILEHYYSGVELRRVPVGGTPVASRSLAEGVD